MRRAMSRTCTISKSRSPGLAITRLGTWIDARAGVALICRFMRSSATAAPGLADFRMYEANHSTRRSSDS
jgi:hypothetical protein